MQKRVSVDAEGKAEVSFSGVPATPVVGQMLIDGGSLGGKADFHGAADLVSGENVLELAPVGSGHTADLSANLLLEVMKVPELVKAAPAKLVTSIKSSVQTTINKNLSGFELYQQAMTDFVAATPFVGLTYTRIAIGNDGGLKTETGSTDNWAKTPEQLWQGIDNGTGLLAYRVIRQGFSEVTPPLVVFKDSAKAKFALALIEPANGSILKYFIADGTTLSHLSAVVANKDFVIGGAVANGLPVVFRWNSNVSVYSGWPAENDLAWGIAFPGITADSGLNYPAVEQLAFMPGVDDTLHAVVRDPASLMLGTYLIKTDGTITIRQAPPAPGEDVLWPLTVFPGNKSTTVHWDEVPNADFYTLYWSLTEDVPTSGEGVNKIDRPTRPFVHTGLQGEVTYFYRLSWTINGTEKGPSRVASATTWIVTENPTYRVVYYGNNQHSGLPPLDGNYYETGAKATILDNIRELSRNGFVFSGWNTATDGSGTNYNPGSEFIFDNQSLTLYANWQVPGFKLTYDGNGNTEGSVPVDAGSYSDGAQATVAANSGSLGKTGLVFGGWNTAATGNGTTYQPGDTIAMAADTTLYALWQTTFKVTYDANSGVGEAPQDSAAYATGAEVTVKANSGGLSRSGYTFSGWNTASDRSGTSYQPGEKFSMGSGDVVLYAKWIPNTLYEVTYDGNGSDGGSVPAAASYLEETLVTVSANSGNLTNGGTVFQGWNTKADGSGLGYAPGSTFVMGTTAVTLYAQWQEFAGGSGTPEDPYLVANALQLNLVRNHLDKHFKQTADIDLGVVPFNSGEGWEPIGKPFLSDTSFTGTYDGNFKKISNLFINRPTEDYVGIFGYVSGSEIKTLTIENSQVTGKNVVGPLVGQAMNSSITTCVSSGQVNSSGARVGGLIGSGASVTIHDCDSTVTVTGVTNVGGLTGEILVSVNASTLTDCNAGGAVTGESSVGGFAGFIDGKSTAKTTLQTCNATGAVTGNTASIGGLVGTNGGYAEITNSTASGKVTAVVKNVGYTVNDVGGFVGFSYGVLSKCSATGNVEGGTAGFRVGGLVGQAETGSISKCSATGSVSSENDQIGGFVGLAYVDISDSYAGSISSGVTGRNSVGGFVGKYHSGTIARCHSVSRVTGGADQPRVGGFAGFADGSISASYWDTEASGKATSTGEGTADATGLTTVQMKQAANFGGWDFTTVWMGADGNYYPMLRP
jgi:uncharacterized repeat protein (TIGR02543 family)